MPISDWTPAPADVGAILRARTKDTSGNEIGTFNSDTRPTDTEVVTLITQAVQDVSMVVGTDIPAATWPAAKSVSTVGAACYVELSFFPEQINSGRSPYPQLKDMYDQQLKQLIMLVQANGGDVVGPTPGVPMEPVADFPLFSLDPYLIGRGTRW